MFIAAEAVRSASMRSAKSIPRAMPERRLTMRCLSMPVDTRRTLPRYELDQTVEPHQATALAGHVEAPDGIGIVAVARHADAVARHSPR